jgi:hypothetical protein
MTEEPTGQYRYIYATGKTSPALQEEAHSGIGRNAIGWVPTGAIVEEIDNRPKVIIIEDCFGYYRTVFQAANGDIGEVYDPTSKEIALADGGDTDNFDIITEITTPESVEWLQ